MKCLALLLLVASTTSAMKWAVTENNVTCVVMEVSAIHGKINILDVQNKTVVVEFTATNTTAIQGSCNDKHGDVPVNRVTVNFFPDGTPKSAIGAQPFTLNLYFGAHGNASNSFDLVDYDVTVGPTEKYNITTETLYKSKTAEIDVTASSSNGFKCSTSGLALDNDSTIELKDVKAIALVRLDTPDFPKEQLFETCKLDTRTSDIVPIVVGACLAGLVVVVLVAYLIGRARARRQGYASV